MTTFAQPDLLEAIAEADKESRATVELVGNDWRADEDFSRFVTALEASVRYGLISQNTLRLGLLEDTVDGPRCSIEPHRYSAFFSRASAHGFIRKAKRPDGRTMKDTCTTSPTGNNGKDQVVYEWLGDAA